MAIVFLLQLKGKADGREDPDSNDGRREGWQIETATMADGREDPDRSDGRRRQQQWQTAEKIQT